MINTKYRISEDDYVKAMQLFAKLTPRQIYICVAIVVILITTIVFGTNIIRAATIGGAISGLTIILIFKFIVNPFYARQQYKKYKAIQDEFEIEIVDDGVNMTSSSGSGKVAWDSIFKWRHNENYILIYPMPRLYYIVPKSLQAGGFNIDLLMQQLTKHVGNPK
jgi:YcxB-like protein